MEFLNPVTALNGLKDFFLMGGPVLWPIMFTALFIFAFVMERMAYYMFAHKASAKALKTEWEERSDHNSWKAHAVRDEMISQIRGETTTFVAIIKTLVAIAPLLGLLGTVWGMMTVFDVMALSGSSNAQGMAGGVFKATIPTMAGMTIALVGLFMSTIVERASRLTTARFADSLEIY